MAPRLSTQPDGEPAHRTMSLRQLALAVNNGRMVTFHIFDNDPVTGYFAAMDPEYFLVLVISKDGNTFSRRMVARSSITLVDLHDAETYKSEFCRNGLDEIVGPFRAYLAKNVLGRQEPMAPRKVG